MICTEAKAPLKLGAPLYAFQPLSSSVESLLNLLYPPLLASLMCPPFQSLQAMAEQAHQACLQLERDLRQELRGKNFYEPSVRLLRQQLCSAYEAVLLQHYAVAQVRRSCKCHRR